MLVAVALTAAALVLMPIGGVGFMAFGDVGPLWAALWQTVLPDYVITTLGLMAAVALGTLVIGVGTGWLVSACRFPGRNVLSWALLLPLAMPAYVVAYAATDALDYAGPVQALIRSLGGFAGPRDYWFPEIRSFGGAASILTLVLYPYVYLSARAAFMAQSGSLSEIARTLGHGPWAVFFRVALPLARPAIIVGLSLALMETLNDFGTVDFFAVRTLSAGLYDVWLTFESRAGAAQIALTMLGFVALLLSLERMGRRAEKRYGNARK
ncbi:MAG: ABC transporter permease, partial [Alphaproteobacteria bacterium]